MSKPQKKEGLTDAQKLRRAEAVMGLVWFAIIVVCLVNQKDFTLERILNYTPSQPLLAAMVSIPYWLGKKLGSRAVQYIRERYPKAATLHELRSGSDFFFVLIMRLLGILPADILSAYMGAVGIQYRDYLPACLLGFLAACILFPIMGMNISNPNSPQFMMAAGIDLAAMLTSCIVFHFYRKKRHTPA